MSEKEYWKDISGYENLYQVSNLGKIRSIKNGKIKMRSLARYSPSNTTTYYKITLCKDGKRETKWVHRIVAEAFIPNPDKLEEVNHKDENGLNNSIDNLEWCTHKYNNNYGTKNRRTSDKLSKAVEQYDLKGRYIRTFKSAKEACEYLNVDISNRDSISKVCNGKRKTCLKFIWKYAQS